ncbi:ubiquitin domain-containing protein UBFD1-like [Daktulosphaira vitifoliae]|uniref:ubiquitin domain-containing protein UBFD1-like n=1 Tax=Daktulosphaira vitifoliae TaxID=58002 RepID=UPI0021AA1C4E|nr:ubiquitin domain-containing protein UBFD1-like [Daktulosphaira vitifoliae]
MESPEKENIHEVTSEKPILVDDCEIKKDANLDICDETAATVELTIIHNKDKYLVTMPFSATIGQLKNKLVDIIGVPSKMQKIMIKGLAKDDQTLESLNVNTATKIMVVGAKLQDIVAVSVVSPEESSSDSASTSTKEPLCKKKLHYKILERGIPEDVMVGILNVKDPLPPHPLSGMLNKHGGKVRLTFKLELDQLWIGTKERTQKIAMNTIKHVVNEPIDGHEEYHIVVNSSQYVICNVNYCISNH